MYWIMYVETEPPEWMKHNPTFQTKNGYTLEMLWKEYVDTEPPKWMKL